MPVEPVSIAAGSLSVPGATRNVPPEFPVRNLDNVDFGAIDHAATVLDEALLLMLVASSFVESGTHLYSSNLIAHFQEDDEVTAWLAQYWEPEELRHGRALRTYVAHVWPTFDWERAYNQFISDYSSRCSAGKLESRRGLEMAARCVVETGTTALYRAIHQVVREPVLRLIVRRISEEEIGHYKHFFRYFCKYQRNGPCGRTAVLGALIRRSIEIAREDTDCGLRYAYAERLRDATAPHPTLGEIRRSVNAVLRTGAPVALAAAMWLRPLQLDHRIEQSLSRVFCLGVQSLTGWK